MTMTVQQLIEALERAPRDAEVRIAYDSGCAYSDAKSVEIEQDCIYISSEEETSDEKN